LATSISARVAAALAKPALSSAGAAATPSTRGAARSVHRCKAPPTSAHARGATTLAPGERRHTAA
jgi:hypothetical protein